MSSSAFARDLIVVDGPIKAKDVKCRGCVDARDIGDGEVTGGKIQEDAVTADKIAEDAVSLSKLSRDVRVSIPWFDAHRRVG